jgi:hypothetical protein
MAKFLKIFIALPIAKGLQFYGKSSMTIKEKKSMEWE